MVTDTGGINDQSFNALAWQGLQRAKEELGVEVSYLESVTEADYATNLETLYDEGNDLIICIGWDDGRRSEGSLRGAPGAEVRHHR